MRREEGVLLWTSKDGCEEQRAHVRAGGAVEVVCWLNHAIRGWYLEPSGGTVTIRPESQAALRSLLVGPRAPRRAYEVHLRVGGVTCGLLRAVPAADFPAWVAKPDGMAFGTLMAACPTVEDARVIAEALNRADDVSTSR